MISPTQRNYHSHNQQHNTITNTTTTTTATTINRNMEKLKNFDSKNDNRQRFLKVPDSETNTNNTMGLALINNGSQKILNSHRDGSPTNTLRVPWKIVVLGNAGVGKTSLVKQYLSGHFNVAYNPTVEDSYLHNINLNDGLTQCIEILDTSGFYEFPAMRELNIRLSSACILVFDINREESLNECVELNKVIRQIKGTEKLPIVLVGNKCDNNTIPNRTINEKATKLAQDVLKCPYFEASAKDNKNVHPCFARVVELVSLQLESTMRRESINQPSSTRRNSTMSFVRRISINTSPKKSIFTRRFSEPVVSNNETSLNKKLDPNTLAAALDEENRIAGGRKKSKNCTIS